MVSESSAPNKTVDDSPLAIYAFYTYSYMAVGFI